LGGGFQPSGYAIAGKMSVTGGFAKSMSQGLFVEGRKLFFGAFCAALNDNLGQ